MSNLNAKKGALFGNKAGSSSTGGKTTASTTLNNTTSAATTQPKTIGMTSKATGTTISNDVKLKKINEAKEWSEKGMKFLKTSVFQWEPDHLAAAPCFEKSAAAYKAAGEDELARKLLLQSAISCEKSNTLSSGALALVKASEIAKSQGNIDYCIQDLEKAAELYGIDGKIDNCADIYFKIGKALQGNKQFEKDNKVLPYFYKAINLLCPEDAPKQNLDKVNINVLEMFRNTFTYLLHNDKYEEALKFAKDRMVDVLVALEMEPTICKTMATITLLQLTLGDVVAADRTFLDYLGNSMYIKSKECRLAETFLMAMKNYNIEMLDSAQASEDLFLLEKDVIVIAKGLSVMGENNFEVPDVDVNNDIDNLINDEDNKINELEDLSINDNDNDNDNEDEKEDENEDDDDEIVNTKKDVEITPEENEDDEVDIC